MSEIIILNKPQRLIIDPPSRTVSIVSAGNVTKEAMDAAVAAALAPYPKGILKLHTLITPFNTVAPHTTFQDEGLTCTVNEPPGRSLRIQFAVQPYPSGGLQHMQYGLSRNGVSLKSFSLPLEATNAAFSHHITYTYIHNTGLGASNVVWKLQLRAATNNTVVSSHGVAAEPRQLFVEDLGPTPT